MDDEDIAAAQAFEHEYGGAATNGAGAGGEDGDEEPVRRVTRLALPLRAFVPQYQQVGVGGGGGGGGRRFAAPEAEPDDEDQEASQRQAEALAAAAAVGAQRMPASQALHGMLIAPVLPAAYDPDDLIGEEFKGKMLPNRTGKGETHVSYEDYYRMLVAFNEGAAFHLLEGAWVQVLPSGAVVTFNTVAHAQTAFDSVWLFGTGIVGLPGGAISFFSYAKTDPRHRVIDTVDPSRFGEANLPSTVLAPETFFEAQLCKLPAGFDDDLRQRILRRFIDLTDIVFGCDRARGVGLENSTYAKQYVAHLLQHRWSRPDTALVAFGAKRCGKDMWGLVIGGIVGRDFGRCYDRVSQFFEKHDAGRDGALWVHLQEMTPVEARRYSGDLQAYVTSPYVVVNHKGRAARHVKNHMRMYITTNDAACFDRRLGETRYAQFTTLSTKQGDHAWWADTAELLLNPAAASVLYTALMGVDVSAFQPRAWPRSEFDAGLDEADRAPIEVFTEWWATKLSVAERAQWFTAMAVHAEYQHWCAAVAAIDKPKVQDVGGFTIQLLAMGARGVGVRTRRAGKRNLFQALDAGEEMDDEDQDGAGAGAGAGAGVGAGAGAGAFQA